MCCRVSYGQFFIFACSLVLSHPSSTLVIHANSNIIIEVVCSLCSHLCQSPYMCITKNPTIQPNPSLVVPDEGDAFVPVTSLMNAWKPSWKRKESTMMKLMFKNLYGKQTKHQQSSLESLDPCPVKYHLCLLEAFSTGHKERGALH